MGDTASRESSSGAVSSSHGINDNDFDFTKSLAEFDRLCANDDPVAILRDLANTHIDQDDLDFRVAGVLETETGTDEELEHGTVEEEPTLSDKYRHLARRNRDLARRVALCQNRGETPAFGITCRSSHLLEYLCWRAYMVPPELFSIILDVAPEAARIRGYGGRGDAAVGAALGSGLARLGVIRNLVTVGDRGHPKSESTLSARMIDNACDWSRDEDVEFFRKDRDSSLSVRGNWPHERAPVH
mmetsp:Transcript_19671/g.42388  ORF Transcript_19671/g.42388 Transcript_19671/m.42388 type:complete len:243 (-) Transcript_19671:448-1176(-)